MSIILFFSIIFIYFELLLRILSFSNIFINIPTIIILSILMASIVNFFAQLFRKKSIFLNIILIILTILYLTEFLINLNFMSYMTFSYIFANALNVLSNFTSEISNLISSKIFFLLLFILPIILFNIIKRFLLNRRKKIFHGLIIFIFILIVSVGDIIYINISDDIFTAYNYNDSVNKYGLVAANILLPFKNNSTNFSKNPQNTDVLKTSLNKTSEYEYNILNIDFNKLNIENDTNDNIKNINSYLSTITPTKKNKYTGLFQNKNLILICAESLSKPVINKNLTPTLYRLVHEGFDFTNYYAPYWGGSTGGGEFAFLTGIIPTSWNTALGNTTKNNMNFTVPAQLKELGYNTFAFHNGSFDFYHRNISHPKLGFDTYLAFGNGLEDYIEKKYDDTELFDKTFDIYKDKKPFCTYFMTYSGHYPYVNSAQANKYIDIVKKEYGDKYDEATNGYLAKQLYLEYGLEKLLTKLKENNMLEDTVICMTTDHYPYPLDEKDPKYVHDENALSKLYGIEFNNENKYKKDESVCILWSGSLENSLSNYKTNIDTVTYTMDIIPTLLNLFGVNFDSRIYPGKDIFSSNNNVAIWNNFSFLTDKLYFNKKSNIKTIFDDNLDNSYVEKYQNMVADKINYSTSFIDYNYFDYFNNHVDKNIPIKPYKYKEPVVASESITYDINVEFILPRDIYRNKADLFVHFFADFYDYIINERKGEDDLAKAGINNLEEFYAFLLRFEGGAQGMPHVGDALGKYFATKDIGGKIENQNSETSFVGYCISKQIYIDFLDFCKAWFYHFRIDEGITGTGKNQYEHGSDFLAYPHDTIIDIAKFFYYDKNTIPKFFIPKKNIPNLMNMVPGMINNELKLLGNILPIPDCYNYTFEGWYDNENFIGEPIKYIDDDIAEKYKNDCLKLYGKFQKNIGPKDPIFNVN